jgi:hypothetical protein
MVFEGFFFYERGETFGVVGIGCERDQLLENVQRHSDNQYRLMGKMPLVMEKK